jgi:hypothetical protein
MSSSRLIIFYFIFGLVSYSYGFNGGNNNIRRRIRGAEFKDQTQNIVNNIMDDESSLDSQSKDSTNK